MQESCTRRDAQSGVWSTTNHVSPDAPSRGIRLIKECEKKLAPGIIAARQLTFDRTIIALLRAG